MTARLPDTVASAWGVLDAVALPGGEGQALRAGDLVLKPAPERERTSWMAGVIDTLATDPTVRITRPAPSISGEWVVDGWSAWRWLDGEHREHVWDEVLEVSARFHAAVERVPWSVSMIGSDKWSVADRAAWGESDAELPEVLSPLHGMRRPVDLPSQLIHGDLAGNVLFHDSLAPAVIDVSPYWRPRGYADAIIVADAIARGGADETLVESLLRHQGDQLLLRAIMFRVVTDPDSAPAYRSLIELLTS